MNPLEALSHVDHASYLEQLADMSAIRYDAGILEDLLRNMSHIAGERVVLTQEEIQDEVYKRLLKQLNRNIDQVNLNLHRKIVALILQKPEKLRTAAVIDSVIIMAIDSPRRSARINNYMENE